MLSESDYLRLRRLIVADFKNKLAALNTLAGKPANTGAEAIQPKKHLQSKVPTKTEEPQDGTNDGSVAGLETLAGTIRNLVLHMGGEFTMPQIYIKLKSQNPQLASRASVKSTISHYLKRLQRQGDLVIVKKGGGKIASVFRRLNPNGSMTIGG